MTQENLTQLHNKLTTAHHQYARRLRLYAYTKVNDQEICQDLVQETFIKTWKYFVKGGRVDVMKSFLYHVLNHLIVDTYRKQKTYSLDVLLQTGFTPRVDPTDKLTAMIDSKRILAFMRQLPKKYSQVMQLRLVDGYSLKEIAYATGQSANSVAVRVHRGLKKLNQFDHAKSKPLVSGYGH